MYLYLAKNYPKVLKLKEIAAGVIRSESTVEGHLKYLIQLGLVRRNKYGWYSAVLNQVAYDYAVDDAIDYLKSNNLVIVKVWRVKALGLLAASAMGFLLGILVRMVGF